MITLDSNGLNNQRYNLRQCTVIQNNLNRPADKNSTSKYKGVCFDPKRKNKKWRSNIGVKGKQIYLGAYHSEVEAAIAYNEAAKIHFKEFAYINSIPCAG